MWCVFSISFSPAWNYPLNCVVCDFRFSHLNYAKTPTNTHECRIVSGTLNKFYHMCVCSVYCGASELRFAVNDDNQPKNYLNAIECEWAKERVMTRYCICFEVSDSSRKFKHTHAHIYTKEIKRNSFWLVRSGREICMERMCERESLRVNFRCLEQNILYKLILIAPFDLRFIHSALRSL